MTGFAHLSATKPVCHFFPRPRNGRVLHFRPVDQDDGEVEFFRGRELGVGAADVAAVLCDDDVGVVAQEEFTVQRFGERALEGDDLAWGYAEVDALRDDVGRRQGRS